MVVISELLGDAVQIVSLIKVVVVISIMLEKPVSDTNFILDRNGELEVLFFQMTFMDCSSCSTCNLILPARLTVLLVSA